MIVLMLRVAVLLILLLFLPDWYIYKKYIVSIGDKRLRRVYWVPSVLLLVIYLVFMVFTEKLMDEFGTYLVIVLCISVPKLVFTLLDLVLKLIRKLLRLPRFETPFAAAAALCSFGYIFYGAVWGREHFQVKEVTFSSPDLPKAFDGYRIVQISDFHIGTWNRNKRAVSRIIELCNEQQADIVLFTGDLVNMLASELPDYMSILSELHAKDGVYSVLGNHDYGDYVRWPSPRDKVANLDRLKSLERELGWDLLLNEHRVISRGSEQIAIVGVENYGKPPFPQKGKLHEALRGTDGLFKILLSHDPTHWRMQVLPESDVQLTLSGHTHDMQVNLFGFSPSKYLYPEHNGMYLEGERGLYVNIGLGVALFPIRVGAWPEITVIKVKSKK